MRFVYRVENPITKEGPYRVDDRSEALFRMARNHADGEHPCPSTDGIFDLEHWEVCGFLSLGALRRWFKGYCHDLRDSGFMARVFEVEDEYVRAGNIQCVFDRSQAISEKNIPWKEVISMQVSTVGTPGPKERENHRKML